ncbi:MULTISPECIES: oligosaccharide flippase family protein [Rhodococcus]|nr:MULTISPECIES: oligosaccharide flippase family protein [Rhodococcus]
MGSSTPGRAPERDDAGSVPAPETVPVGTLSGKLRRGAAMAAAGLLIVQGVTFVQTLVLARLLSPEIVGVFAAGTVMTTFLVVVTHGTLAQALVQREHDVENAATTVFWVTLGTGILMSLVMLAASPLIGRIFNSPAVGTVAAAMSGSMLLIAITSVPDALMQRRFQFKRRIIVDPAVGITFAAGSIVFAALGYGVWSLVIGSYSSMLVWIVASWWLSRWHPFGGRFSIRLWREMAVFSFPLLLDGAAARAQEVVELTIIGRGLSEAALGNYRYGRRIALLPGMAIVQVCSYVLFPAFARISADSQRFKDAFLRALSWIWRVAMPAGALMVAVGEPAVVVLLGEPWRGAGVAVASMSGFGLGVAMNSVSAEAMKGAGRSSRMNWMTAAGLLTGVPLLLLLLPLGLAGVGLAVSGAAIVVGITGLGLARSVVGASGGEIARVMAPPVIASLAAFAVIAPLERYVVQSDQRSIAVGLAAIALECVAFLIAYLLTLRLVAPSVFAEIREAVRSVGGRVARAVRGER